MEHWRNDVAGAIINQLSLLVFDAMTLGKQVLTFRWIYAASLKVEETVLQKYGIHLPNYMASNPIRTHFNIHHHENLKSHIILKTTGYFPSSINWLLLFLAG
jgi:hypothetical protein